MVTTDEIKIWDDVRVIQGKRLKEGDVVISHENFKFYIVSSDAQASWEEGKPVRFYVYVNEAVVRGDDFLITGDVEEWDLGDGTSTYLIVL